MKTDTSKHIDSFYEDSELYVLQVQQKLRLGGVCFGLTGGKLTMLLITIIYYRTGSTQQKQSEHCFLAQNVQYQFYKTQP